MSKINKKEVYNLPNDICRCSSKICPKAVDCARAYLPTGEGMYPIAEFKCHTDKEDNYFIPLRYKK